MIKKKSAKVDRVFEIFVGEFIEVVTSRVAKSIETNEETQSIMEAPLSYSGVLLDADDHHYFLGGNDAAVTACIRRDIVDVIRMAEMEKEPSIYQELLDNMPEPDPEDIN